uniref:Uncharacterized protein n=1 Tax=Ditylenchus dipsaci TaxID=166011 RepID=A0A915CWK4_9BILA
MAPRGDLYKWSVLLPDQLRSISEVRFYQPTVVLTKLTPLEINQLCQQLYRVTFGTGPLIEKIDKPAVPKKKPMTHGFLDYLFYLALDILHYIFPK